MNNARSYSLVSIVIIGLCGVVALLSNLGSTTGVLQYLFIAQPGTDGLQDVLSGQVWRLLTPIFIHFGFMHFLFNMMWVWDLGKLIELRKGAAFYVGFVVVVGAVSNLAQYQLTHSPFFGGMSGVVYGLFGYIWIRGRVDPTFGVILHKTTVVMMLAWFVLCWTGLLGPIANWAHTVGLVVGALWGLMGSRSGPVSDHGVAATRQHEQRVEYLSTSDILKLESQRQWVRNHTPSDARHLYETIEGKLDIIGSILSGKTGSILTKKAASADHDEEFKSLDIAFGDAIVQKINAQWATLDDADGKRPILLVGNDPMIIFPVVTISRLAMGSGPIDMHQLFNETIESINRQIHRSI